MPKNMEELAEMLARRDGISYEEELAAIHEVAAEIETVVLDGNPELAEILLADYLGLEPDYLDIFLF